MLRLFLSLICLGLVLCLKPFSLSAQTQGELTFSVTTVEPPGGYNNVNVVALWIEDSAGAFIKTKVRYAEGRIQYLDRWILTSDYNVVDAVIGPTRSGHDPLIFVWNATDTAGVTVPDGKYRVWMQMSDRNVSGTNTYVEFVKGADVQSITPSDTGYYTSMSLQWNPVAGTQEKESRLLGFSCDPNPFTDLINIRYGLSELSDVTVSLHDLAGSLVAMLFDGNRYPGENALRVSGRELNLAAGAYVVRINTGRAAETRKIIYAP